MNTPRNFPRADRAFFRRDTVALARLLLGQRLVRQLPDGTRLAGIISETEAYLGPEDKAAHTFGGRHTPRNHAMWLDAGTTYVYFTYGMHHCMNVVAEREGIPQAALLRALVPTEGLGTMQLLRPKARRPEDYCSGPAKLCQALAIDRTLNESDLTTSSDLWIEVLRDHPLPDHQILAGPRVGIGYAEEWVDRPLRFRITPDA